MNQPPARIPLVSLADSWPEVADLLLDDDKPWRADVDSWLPPWRKAWSLRVVALMDEGVPWREAEERAQGEIRESMANPRGTAGKLVGGGKVVKDAVARPKMVRKSRRVAAGQGEMFGESDDDNATSTTYMREEKR